MNTIRKFVTGFSDLWQKYQPLNAIYNLTSQQLPNLLQNVNPYKTIITTMKKGYDKLNKMIVRDVTKQKNQKSVNNNEQNTDNAENNNEQNTDNADNNTEQNTQNSENNNEQNNNEQSTDNDAESTEQTSNPLEDYEVHEPYKKFKNIAYTYLIKDKFLKPDNTTVSGCLYLYRKKVDAIIDNILNKELEKLTGVKYNFVLNVVFGNKTEAKNAGTYFWSSDIKNATVITHHSKITKTIDKNFMKLQEKIDEFINNGSGWALESIEQLEINIVKYTPLKGSSYIELPYAIRSKHACVNVKNKDDECFRYAVLSAIFPVDRNHKPNDVKHYKPHFNKLNWDGIEYPVEIDKIKKFEKQNPKYGINVFLLENKNEITPRIICKEKEKIIINLLLIAENDKKHYVWIKDFSRLVSSGVSKHGHTMHYCYNCLCHFSTEALLIKHMESGCYNNACAKIILPTKEDAFIEYTEAMMKKQLKVPFIIYADFEAMLKGLLSNKQYQEHIACSYGYKVVSHYDEYKQEYKTYRGPNAINKFLESLIEEEKYIVNILNRNEPMVITPAEKKKFKKATHCHICEKELENDKVRDHDHITGEYRGAAHSNCNINYNYKNVKIPVVFHNLRGYDSHLIMQEIGKYAKDITVIPNTTEKYITFTMNRLVFIDSIQFMNESLEKLAESLLGINDKNKEEFPISYFIEKNIHRFSNLLEDFKNCSKEQIELLVQKGVYPYDYMNSWEKFEELELPSKSKFYSKLNDSSITKKDYERAKKVFKLFKCKNLGDYHDIYLKTDVLLLADVFENFRKTCMNNYKLDPAHFYTSPGLSWLAMLKKTGKRIELFNDEQVDMLNLFEQNKRGGICMISKRYAKANNKYMKDFNPLLLIKYIMYLDANNLYGWAMSQLLPTGNFKWENPNDFNQERILKLNDAGKRGYYFEVDLEYPKKLHDLHNDYPMAPENIQGEYSPKMKKLLSKHDVKVDKSKKLIPNLKNKTKYGVHYRLLKFYLSHGLKLTKIHRVVSFDQEAWLKPYIDFNTQMRAKASSDFEKGFFKLLNNAIYGKCCENIRKRKDIKLCTSEKKAQRLFNKPTYKDNIIFKNDELIAVEMAKTQIKYDKPVYLGPCILDLSKLLMYQFHYDHIKPLYGDKANLLFTDTDSLCYEIQTDDVYEDMLKHKEMYDFSEYPEEHKCFDKTNKKVIGKFKDEAKGRIITEFIGLRPKLYSYIIEGEKEELKKLELKQENKKGKGVKATVIKNILTHENYYKALFGITKEELIQNVKFNIIKSKNHIMYSEEVDKIGLSCLDNKRYVCDDNINTYAIGHYKIENN